MHRSLQTPEILPNIFGHCPLPSSGSAASDLPVLDRTCRAFKGPALDTLWKELFDLSALAHCLPEVSHHSQADKARQFQLIVFLCLIANMFS